MDKFHHSMRSSAKDHKILEGTYNECGSVYINWKLTDVTLNCTVFVINVNITDFAAENYIRIGRNTHQYSHW